MYAFLFIARPSHRSWFGHPIKNRWELLIKKLFNMQFSPVSCYLLYISDYTDSSYPRTPQAHDSPHHQLHLLTLPVHSFHHLHVFCSQAMAQSVRCVMLCILAHHILAHHTMTLATLSYVQHILQTVADVGWLSNGSGWVKANYNVR